ncbi:Cof-type HAD-IIB family hydrolase [soil metagenome]
MPIPALTRYRLLALDVDGTLLDRDGRLRPGTSSAVERAARAGIQPVLCTGRRYRRALPVALELGLDVPIVCNSGALVKEPEGHRTLWRADLEQTVLAELLALLNRRGEPAVSMIDHGAEAPDFLVPARPVGRELFDEYVERNGPYARVAPDWMERPADRLHFHLFAIGPRPEMLDLEALILAELPGLVRTFVQRSPLYAGTMCEVLQRDASKWSAVLHLAELWGIAPEEICAVGDDMNDIPMIAGAGLGVAMGHAPADVLAAADYVTEDHDNDGVAALIHGVLLK